MRLRRLLPCLIILLSACSQERMENAFVEGDDLRLMVGGAISFTYEPNTCQLAFSRDLKEFRAFTDNMSDYYIVTFREIPAELGQIVTANLIWTTERDVLERKNLTLEVVRSEGDQLWLWSRSGRIGVNVRILEDL